MTERNTPPQKWHREQCGKCDCGQWIWRQYIEDTIIAVVQKQNDDTTNVVWQLQAVVDKASGQLGVAAQGGCAQLRDAMEIAEAAAYILLRNVPDEVAI